MPNSHIKLHGSRKLEEFWSLFIRKDKLQLIFSLLKTTDRAKRFSQSHKRTNIFIAFYFLSSEFWISPIDSVVIQWLCCLDWSELGWFTLFYVFCETCNKVVASWSVSVEGVHLISSFFWFYIFFNSQSATDTHQGYSNTTGFF